jgi:uncharacterized protein
MRQALRLGILLGIAAFVAGAVDWKALKPTGFVSDFAGVVDPSAKTQLEIYCAMVERSTGAQLAFVTVPSIEGEPVEDVANALYRAWGVGQKGKDEGVLLLLSVNDHRSRLEVGYGLEPILTDGALGGVLREMRPALRAQHYGEAMMAAAETIGEKIAQAKNVTLAAKLPRRERPAPVSSGPWPLLIVVGVFFILQALFRRGGGRGGGMGGGIGGALPWLILGNMMGRSSFGGRGSGGFGGFDSGDGFGGFGGGDSGGGGASGDW